MSLVYRITQLPVVWPGQPTPTWKRSRAPFKTIETKALALLEREVRMLGGKNVEIAVDVEPRMIRQDGMLYANARPKSPGVILSFDTKQGRLAFPCDRFAYFWSNIDAIARSLEDLRRVDRYGVQQGKQYTGFKALPEKTGATLTTAQAAEIIIREAGATSTRPGDLLANATSARDFIRLARNRAHPDRSGGAADRFAAVEEAKRVLEAHHGGAL